MCGGRYRRRLGTLHNPILAEALRLQGLGFSVIPIVPGAKAPPIVRFQKYRERLPTVDEIHEWFEDRANRNLGLVTGKLSGVVVFDVDEHTLMYNFLVSRKSAICETPRGAHWYFKYPEFDLGNRSNRSKHVDLRGEGGYVIVPPSKITDASGYTWDRELVSKDLPDYPQCVQDIFDG